MQAKLKAILFERGVLQKDIAATLGITPRTLSKKMRGQLDFTYSEVYNICRVLGINNPLDVFLPRR